MGLFSSSRKKKDEDGPTATKNKKGIPQKIEVQQPPKPKWDDAWTRKTVEPEEVQELLRGCTVELKSKALDTPFLLLPFRPRSDPSAAKSFIRNYFDKGPSMGLHGEYLTHELRLTEPTVLCSVVKWCWSRIAGGVVGWDAYQLFKIGEQDSDMAIDSFKTFIPLSVESDARAQIIFDFFELLAAIAAHAKTNGLGGRKLSRLAGWWAFEHRDTGNGFDGGYKGWEASADATSHLFFAYLRSLGVGMNGVSTLPRSLQALVQETEYPPEKPSLLQTRTIKVVMIVDQVSPTPFALLRRTNRFQYRDEDHALQEFSEYSDPISALTEECRRVMKAISMVNQNTKAVASSGEPAGPPDASWSRFEDIGFSGTFADEPESKFAKKKQGLRTSPASGVIDMGRPTTPSWADFMSSGFVDEASSTPSPLLLPPDKILPPLDIENRGRSSQSHNPRLEGDANGDQGELASITRFDLDEAFWWVWISSLGGEESPERKAAFGRCALAETVIRGGKWLVMEEMVQGAAPEPVEGAYIAEKKGFFSWGKRSKGVARSKSTGKPDKRRKEKSQLQHVQANDESKTSVGSNQHARIQAAAAQLQEKQRREAELAMYRNGRLTTDQRSQKTNSVFTLQPVIKAEALPAMKWANKYDKDAIKDEYLRNNSTGRGLGQATMQSNDSGLLSPTDPYPRSPSISDRRSPSALSHSGNIEPSALSPQALEPLSPLANGNGEETADYGLESPPMSPLGSRKPLPGRTTPSFTEPSSRAQSTEPPMDYDPSEDKPIRLQKEKKSGGGGLRKLFGRKPSRAPPPSAHANIVKDENQKPGSSKGGLMRRLSRSRKGSRDGAASPSPVQPSFVASASEAFNEPPTPYSPVDARNHSFVNSRRSSISRVDTEDAEEALNEFSRFDQGPLEDQPAFIPDSPDTSPRQSEESPVLDDNAEYSPDGPPAAIIEESESDEATPQEAALDRWAQIRKNAAERAAQNRQSEERSHGGTSTVTDGDAETSGEETIESRVARIKARVAELTGNMDTGAPLPVNDLKSKYERMNRR